MTQSPQPERPQPVLTKNESRLLFVIVVVALVGLGIVASRRLDFWFGPEVSVVTVGPESEPLDLNAAEWWELDTLPGIGQTRARAIVEIRQTIQGFQTVDELVQVPGVTAGLVEQLKPLLKVGEYRPKDSRE